MALAGYSMATAAQFVGRELGDGHLFLITSANEAARRITEFLS
jgi:hypothetical protein